MNSVTVPCPRCHGSGERVEHCLTGVDGDTSYDHIDCRVCGGAERVPAAWAKAWDQNGFESRCDHCRGRRPCAIMENPAGEIVIVCAKCAAATVGASALQEAAS